MAGEISSTRRVRMIVSVKGAQGFGAAKRQNFLDALAATCNITKSARFAGVALTTVYRARARDVVFAEQWREAMVIGYDRLEALVLEHGGAGGPIEIDVDRAETLAGELAPFDFDRAMSILKYAASMRNGQPNRRSGRPPVAATREETNAALIKAIAAVHKRRALPAPDGADAFGGTGATASAPAGGEDERD